jgi:carboxymethylenebutenolidase
MENKEKYVMLAVPDGTEMAAYTATPQDLSGQAPGMLLLQEAFGVNHHIRDVAERFAKLGFVVIAPELFHRSAPVGFEGSYSDFAAIMPHFQALTPEGQEADLKAAFKWLLEHDAVQKDKIYSIGYCLGGRVSFLANAILPIAAGISYYGGSTHLLKSKAADLHGKHLFFWGGKDQHIKQEDINEVITALDEAGKDYINVKISYADHGFNCDARPSYNEAASKEALALTLAFIGNN